MASAKVIVFCHHGRNFMVAMAPQFDTQKKKKKNQITTLNTRTHWKCPQKRDFSRKVKWQKQTNKGRAVSWERRAAAVWEPQSALFVVNTSRLLAGPILLFSPWTLWVNTFCRHVFCWDSEFLLGNIKGNSACRLTSGGSMANQEA